MHQLGIEERERKRFEDQKKELFVLEERSEGRRYMVQVTITIPPLSIFFKKKTIILLLLE